MTLLRIASSRSKVTNKPLRHGPSGRGRAPALRVEEVPLPVRSRRVISKAVIVALVSGGFSVSRRGDGHIEASVLAPNILPTTDSRWEVRNQVGWAGRGAHVAGSGLDTPKISIAHLIYG